MSTTYIWKPSDFVTAQLEKGIAGKNSTIYCGKLKEKAANAMRLNTFVDSDLREVGLMNSKIILDAIPGMLLDHGRKFHFNVRSEATGGLSIHECGFDPSQFEIIQFKRKLGNLKRMYIHEQDCPKLTLGTELQAQYYPMGTSLTKPKINNDLTASALNGMMATMTDHFQSSALMGVRGAAERRFGHFDGFLTQSYFAAQKVFFNSAQYTIDTTAFADEKSIAIKAGADTQIFTYNSGITSNAAYNGDIQGVATTNTYSTRKAVYTAAAQWLNQLVGTANNLKMFSATFAGNEFFVTHQWVTHILDIRMQVIDGGTQPNWKQPVSSDNVAYKVIQKPMPVDMRPITYPYVKADEHNAFDVAWSEWKYYSKQLKDADTWEYDEAGNPTQKLEVVYWCDEDFINDYKQSKNYRKNASEDIPVRMVALSRLKGSGMRFFSTVGNLQPMMDTTAGKDTFIAVAAPYLTDIAGTLNFGHELHAFVVVNNFNTVGIPYDHPFFKRLASHEPDADTIACIPCENQEVVNCQIDGKRWESNIAPNFALSIVEGSNAGTWKIVMEDTTTGINPAKSISYAYAGTFNNGADKVLEFTQSGQTGEIAFEGTALNGLVGTITLTVTNGTQTKSITKTVGPQGSDLYAWDFVLPEFTVIVSESATKLQIVDESDFGLDALTKVVYKITDAAGNSEIVVANPDSDGYFHIAEIAIDEIGSDSLDTGSTYTVLAAYQTSDDVAVDGEDVLDNSIANSRYHYTASATGDGSFESSLR